MRTSPLTLPQPVPSVAIDAVIDEWFIRNDNGLSVKCPLSLFKDAILVASAGSDSPATVDDMGKK
jgi:hypothetical protein